MPGTSYGTATRLVRRATVKLRHEPVLRNRAVELWASREAARVVDGTVGRAGHSLLLLGMRPEVRLLAVDRDPEAVEFVRRRFAGFGTRAQVVHGSYADLPMLLEAWGGGPVDGILLDLGVSSPQIDDPRRGFSTRGEGPLDLRFDPGRGETAAQWIARVDEAELERVLREFGEVPRAHDVARSVLRARSCRPLETTADLRRALGAAGRRPGEPPEKALARVFQAIRIAINAELEELDRFLGVLPGLLSPGGRVVVISYHSLEDRRVKRALREGARDCICPPRLPTCACGGGRAWLRVLTRRALQAGAEEIRANPRARSARLRAAERVFSRQERGIE